jgi:hypothetical protein
MRIALICGGKHSTQLVSQAQPTSGLLEICKASQTSEPGRIVAVHYSISRTIRPPLVPEIFVRYTDSGVLEGGAAVLQMSFPRLRNWAGHAYDRFWTCIHPESVF